MKHSLTIPQTHCPCPLISMFSSPCMRIKPSMLITYARRSQSTSCNVPIATSLMAKEKARTLQYMVNLHQAQDEGVGRAMREEGPLKSHASDAAIRVMSCGIAQICWNLHQTLTWISLMRAKLRQLTWVPRLAWAVALSARILSTSLSLECFAWLWHRCQLTTAQQRTTLTQEPLTTSVRPGMGYMHILCLMFGWSCDGERLGLCHPIRPSAFLQWGFVIYHLVVCCIIFQVSHRSWRFMSSSTVALMVLVMQNIILACAAVQRTIQSSVAFLSYGPLGPLTVMNPLHLNLWVPLVLTF